MSVDVFIPRFLKKLDRYLLKNHPNLWITNVHHVLFYGLLIIPSIYFATRLVGFDYKHDEIYNTETPFGLMLLPAILLFVFWFIMQARYNVVKNFGKTSLRHDYQNFLVYMFVISIFYAFAAAIPHALTTNMKNSISIEELMSDVNKLNTGNVYFEGDRTTLINKGSTYIVTPESYPYVYTSDNDYGERDQRIITRAQAIKEIDAFLVTYTKYSRKPITLSADSVLKSSFRGQDILYDFYEYDPFYDDVDWRCGALVRVHLGEYGFMINNSEYMKVVFAILGVFALITWIFKNVHWKNFLSAVVSIVVSPFIIGVVALFLFGLVGINYHQDQLIILITVSLFHAIAFGWFIIPYLKKRYSYMSIITGILLQLWTPFSIFAYYSMIVYTWREWHYNQHYYDQYYKLPDSYYFYESLIDSTYWVGWIVGLISIALMKRYYRRMWAMPKNK